MKTILKQLSELLEKLELIMKLSEPDNEEKPKGWIEVSSPNDYPQYYFCYMDKTQNKVIRKYIPVADIDLVSQVVNENFRHDVHKDSKEKVRKIRNFLKDFSCTDYEDIYENMHPLKKKFIKPIFQTHEQFVTEWLAKPYQSKPFSSSDRLIYTDDGHRVRSKTERFLYNLFLKKNIPFKYECPLQLKDRVVYPDFTFIHPYKKQEIFWEHFGMMDHPEYSVNSYKKTMMYGQNGIFVDDRLILTYEDSMNDLDYKWVEFLVKKYLIKE